jgi:hypothetical protein
MNKNKNSTRMLAVAVVAAVLSTALAVGVTNPAAQQAGAADQTTSNGQPETGPVRHGNGSAHAPWFASSNSLNQTKVSELRLAIHDLWVEHVVWTRQYIVAAAADGPDAGAATERLLKNQEDIGNAIKPFYGDQAGDQLTLLLKDHITIAVDLLEAAKAGNSTAAEIAEEKWYDNADDIATFLSGANPNWTKEGLKSMLNEHLSLTKTEAVARLTGDYDTDVTTFDALYKHAVSMGDEFTAGIVKQFEEQFEVDGNKAKED